MHFLISSWLIPKPIVHGQQLENKGLMEVDSNQTPWQLNSLADANAFCKPSIPEGENRGKFISPALGSDHPGESPGEL